MVKNNFYELGLKPEVLKAIDDMGFISPSKIQRQAIPVLLNNQDVIGQAQTGTGKTLAFGSVLISKIAMSHQIPEAIVIAPTRELAMQIHEEMTRINKYSGLKIACVFGGSEIEKQIRTIKKGIDIIIGTPGRIMDLMRRKVLKLDDVKYVVLDEADEMLQMGFVEDIGMILSKIEQPHQTILFSATMPEAITKIAQNYMKKDYQHIKIHSRQATASTVKQYYYEVKDKDRFEAMCRLIDAANIQTGIIFCRTKKSVDEVTELMQKAGYNVEAMHGDLTQNHRMNTLRKFKQKTINFLVATDVAARGIDVENVSHVINYELPQDEESYIHRIGRTGRANKEGLAYSIITPRQKAFLHQIELATKTQINKAKIPTRQEIYENKIGQLVSQVEDVIFTKQHKPFKSIINEIDSARLLDFSAAMLQMLYTNQLGYNYTKEELPAASKGNDDYVRIFITIGTMDGVRIPHLIEFLTTNAKISRDDIGDIDMKKKYTFMDLKKFALVPVIEQCQGKKLRKRQIEIEIANKKR